MKKLVLLLLSMASVHCTQAQPTFEKIYHSTGAVNFNLIELNSHHILGALAWYPGISLLDTAGNIIHSNCYYSDSVLTMASIRKYNDNEFYFVTGYRKDTCTLAGNWVIPNLHPAIGRMDSMGNILSFRQYDVSGPGCQKNPRDLEITQDKSIITWGKEGQFFALRVDSTGLPIWSKHFGRHGNFQFIKELPGGDLLAGFNMDTAGAVVARLDEMGNILWSRSYIRPAGMVQACIVQSDSSFLITGFTNSTEGGFDPPPPPPLDPMLFMMMLDGNGMVQWCKGYHNGFGWTESQNSRIVETQDGNFVVLANIKAPTAAPFLMKTDQNGDTLWTRSAGVPGYSYLAVNLLAYSDGGFLYDGVIYGDLPDQQTGLPFIYKTDSLGHLPCSDRWQPVDVVDLFPTDSSFTLTSIDGATAYPAFVRDTTFAPLTVYDGCIITSIQNPMRRHQVHVHPNPSSGHFTMDLPDPLTVDSFYSVYDATGRLLFQRPLSKSMEPVEIDLSGYGTGMYLIRFPDRDGVCAERVVVE